MSRTSGRRIKPWIVGGLVVGLVAVAAGLYWFQPWKIWVDETVDEGLPVTPETPVVAQTHPTAPSTVPTTVTAPSVATTTVTTPPVSPAPAGPATLATGRFISHEHTTSGSVRILRTGDGPLVLRLENLDTSNGPDLHVWVTDAPVKPGKDGWGVFDDGAYVSLGKLKGNKGSQNYTLPAGFDLAGYTSVSIWCDRFNVSFGAATLEKTAT